MKSNIDQILKQKIEKIKLDVDILKKINKTADDFCKYLRGKLRKKKIKAEVFIGGSLAKNTLVKKKKQDIDVFVRFDSKYKDNEISGILGKILGKNVKKIHGSRDYYQVVVGEIIIEIIPVLKISKPSEAKNITDLSYFHVNYIKKKLRKNKKLSDEIILSKTFCHAHNCYGAESYIQGFSGYALELLIVYYKSFLEFIKAIVKTGDNKLIIDIDKSYKNKQEILRELNEAKLQSPVILIDSTFKQRNVTAGLSEKTFLKFQKICKKFLKNPNLDFFEEEDIRNKMMKKYKDKLNILVIKTNKQPGDIAGTKSKKFFRFFCRKLGKEFSVKQAEFDYDEKKNIAYFYFVVSKKKNEVIKGPPVTAVHNLTKFKKAHKNTFIKNYIAYVKIKHDLSLNGFMKIFLKKEKKIIKEMNVKKIGLSK